MGSHHRGSNREHYFNHLPPPKREVLCTEEAPRQSVEEKSEKCVPTQDPASLDPQDKGGFKSQDARSHAPQQRSPSRCCWLSSRTYTVDTVAGCWYTTPGCWTHVSPLTLFYLTRKRGFPWIAEAVRDEEEQTPHGRCKKKKKTPHRKPFCRKPPCTHLVVAGRLLSHIRTRNLLRHVGPGGLLRVDVGALVGDGLVAAGHFGKNGWRAIFHIRT
jgi:hypothetical protein